MQKLFKYPASDEAKWNLLHIVAAERWWVRSGEAPAFLDAPNDHLYSISDLGRPHLLVH